MDGRSAPAHFSQHYSLAGSSDGGALNMDALLGKVEECACDTFCQSLQQNIEPDLELFPAADANAPTIHHLPHHHHSAGATCRNLGRADVKDPVYVRKMQKADREKLRRDRLNEHFLELAGALDPDRPKNDKATILGDSIQVLRELSADVSRLRTEHASLVNESHDLMQEKTELHDEKELLRGEVERLQRQVDQHIHAHLTWMAMDPSMMMGLGAFPYPLPAPQPSSVSAEPNQPAEQGQMQQPFVAPNPYLPFPVPPSSLAAYPGLQGYYRLGDGSNMFFPYLPYTPAVNSGSHVERPFAQYPNIVHPLPGYPVQTHVNQEKPASAPYVVHGSGYCCPSIPSSTNAPTNYQGKSPEKQENLRTGMVGNNNHKDDQHDKVEASLNASDGPHQSENSCQDVQLALQLQTSRPCSSAPAQNSTGSTKLEIQNGSNFALDEEEKHKTTIYSTQPLRSGSCDSVSQSPKVVLSVDKNCDNRGKTDPSTEPDLHDCLNMR